MTNVYKAALAAAPQPAQEVQTQAAADVLAERRRQVEVVGWSLEHDDEHEASGELPMAAVCYALAATKNELTAPLLWPWDISWWKPTTPRRNLVKAGALILAEIERLDRAAPHRRRTTNEPRRTGKGHPRQTSCSKSLRAGR